MPRAENKSMPKVESGWLYANDVSFAVGSAAWQNWLVSQRSFYFQSPVSTFTARKELHSGGNWYWYAYRKFAKKLHKVYLGQTHQLTVARLAEIAQQLAEKIEQSN